MNIPLHIAEQGKEKIEEYIDLYEKTEEKRKLATESDERLNLAFAEMQNIFMKEEKVSAYYSEYRLKKRNLWDHIGDYYSGNKVTMDRIKMISQFSDEVWTKSQVLQDAAFERIESLLEYQEAKEKFEEFKIKRLLY